MGGRERRRGRRGSGGRGGGGGADVVLRKSVCPFKRTHAVNQMGWCQRTSPFGWTDQPEKPLRQFPQKAGSRRPQSKTSPNSKSRKKIARHAHLTPLLPLLRRKGSAIFSISSALDALDPD